MKKHHFEFYWLDRDIAKKILEETVDFLEEHQIQAQLAFGTLLGAYREGSFIVYDSDVDISITYADFQRLQEMRLKDPKVFAEVGFIMSAYLIGPDKLVKSVTASKYNTKVDVYVLFEKDGYHNLAFDYKKEREKPYQFIQVPAHFRNNPVKIRFLGREYWCPGNTEEYLALVYGKHWNTRIKAGSAVNETRKLGNLEEFIPKEILEEPE